MPAPSSAVASGQSERLRQRLMGRYRKIDPRIWGDAKFRSLSDAQPNGQTLWLYLLTGPHTTIIPGLSSVGEAALAERLRWSMEAFRKAFAEVMHQGLVVHDKRSPLLWIRNVHKYDKPESPNVVRAWRGVWNELPECELKNDVYQTLKGFTEALGKAFGKAFAEAIAK